MGEFIEVRTYKKYLYFVPSSGPSFRERITPSERSSALGRPLIGQLRAILAGDWLTADPEEADGRDSLLVRGLEYQLRGTQRLCGRMGPREN